MSVPVTRSGTAARAWIRELDAMWKAKGFRNAFSIHHYILHTVFKVATEARVSQMFFGTWLLVLMDTSATERKALIFPHEVKNEVLWLFIRLCSP